MIRLTPRVAGPALLALALALALVTVLPFRGSATAQAIIPDQTLTPGVVRTTDVKEICSRWTAGERHWSRERDDRILEEYDLPAGPHPDFEIGHLIPLGIGGADDDRNLWPEPRRSILRVSCLRTRTCDEKEWSAENKDELEYRLRELVCNHEYGKAALDVRETQKEIADDWTEAYRKYFGGK
jgi:hypothetical protein